MDINITNLVKGLIAKGKIQEAIQAMLVEENSLTKEEVKIVTGLSARLSKLRREKMKGVLGTEQDAIEFSKITYGLLDLIIEIGFKESREPKMLDFLDEAIFELGEIASKYKYLEIELRGVRDSINIHINDTENWCNVVTFKDSHKIKTITQIYVELDCFLTPRRYQLSDSEKSNLIKSEDVFENIGSNLVILGQAGAGKTTTMKKVALSVLHRKKKKIFNFPLFVRLREFNNLTTNKSRNFLVKHLASLLGVNITYSLNFRDTKDKESRKYKDFDTYFTEKFVSRLVINFIDNLKVLVILDGFDELKEEFKKPVIQEITNLSSGLKKSKFVLTTRTGDYHYNIENTLEYEISPLSETQIEEFVKKWLVNKVKSADLTKQIHSSPFADTAIRPLTLAHLCAYYEKYQKIPDKPRTMYKKIINLLLEEWDLQRSIHRVTKYGKFDVDRKFDFLSNLAFLITTKFKASIFNQKQIKEIYEQLCTTFDLPYEQYKEVLNELESHNGLIIKSGYDNYEFAHKSIQEYLTAEYIVKLPEFPNELLKLEFPNEMALAVSISSNSTYYFSTLSLKHIKWRFESHFIESFLDRLLIEKPDFQIDPILGISILRLYTSSSDVSNNTIITRHARTQFIELLKWDVVKKSIKSVFEYYVIFRKLKGGVELTHVNNIDNLFNYKIPLKLLCDEEFIRIAVI